MRYLRSSQASEKAVGNDVAVYVETHRAIHVLNDTARAIWTSLEEPLTFDELLFVMQEIFDADTEALRSDLQAALEQFLTLGIIVTRTDGDDLPSS